MMLWLGPIPQHLTATIERWIIDARQNDPTKLHENGSLLIAGGPSWCNSISPDGTIWMDDYLETRVLTDELARLKTIVIAGKRMPELLEWLPDRPESAIDCDACTKTGWQRLGSVLFLCQTCCGLGWLPIDGLDAKQSEAN